MALKSWEEEVSLEDLLIKSSNGALTIDKHEKEKPLVLRGIGKRKDVRRCREEGRDFYYIDSGYLGNFKGPNNMGGVKIWHRIVKNDYQECEIKHKYPKDRWEALVKHDKNLEWKGWKNFDKKILLIVPSDKSCKAFNVNVDEWIENTVKTIKKYIDIPIELKEKGSRSSRNNDNSIYKAFDTGVYATVSLNSIAGLESVLYGIPAFVSAPCAASPLASTDLSQLRNPFKPDIDLIKRHCWNLAYGQFTEKEIESGFAWKILKDQK